MMRTKPNYKNAKNMALKVLQEHNVTEIPVNVTSILKSYKNIKLITYNEMSRMFNLSKKEIIDINASTDGAIQYSGSRNKYLIAYNENIAIKGRVNWTLAHELGHYILNHHKETNCSLLEENGLSPEQNYVVESEANCFARELLAPPPVLRKLNVLSQESISKLCGLSYHASENIQRFLIKGMEEFGITYTSDDPILELFSNFISIVKGNKCCNKCNHIFSASEPYFCPNCGSDNLAININPGKGNKTIHNSLPADITSIQVRHCPNCKQKQIDKDANYCKICSTFLINKCTGIDSSTKDLFKQSIKWHEVKFGCGELLDENSRYCTKCGSFSTFFQEGLLQGWKHESLYESGFVSNNEN